MSKIDELIEKLCPNGVRFEELKNKKLFKFYYGKGNKIPEDNGGIYNVYGANGVVSHINEYNCEDISIIGHIGAVGMVNRCKEKCFVTYNGTIAEVVDKSKVNSQYLYYVLTTLDLPSYKKGSQPFLSVSDFDKISIPVPPLEVQCEIVHILDDFTLLSAELSAELKARQKQFTYFEEKLLFNNDFEKVKLADLCIVNQGLQIPINQRKKEPAGNRYFYITVQFLKGGDEKYYIESPQPNVICKKEDILVTRTGSTGKIITGVEGCFHNNFFKVEPNERILKRYLYFVLNSKRMYNKMLRAASGGTVPDLPHRKFYNLEIFLPSIEEQEKIINILDRFEKLCNDISEGLPAEIEARQKQYEYYRDKLLTFKELKVNE